jgi:hypothetical protein
MVADPFGYQWFVTTHFADVSPEEDAERVTVTMAAG